MIRIFKRMGKIAKLELLLDEPHRYALRFIDAEGIEHVEHFKNPWDAENRQRDLVGDLSAQGWQKVTLGRPPYRTDDGLHDLVSGLGLAASPDKRRRKRPRRSRK